MRKWDAQPVGVPTHTRSAWHTVHGELGLAEGSPLRQGHKALCVLTLVPAESGELAQLSVKLNLDHWDSQSFFKGIEKRCRVWPSPSGTLLLSRIPFGQKPGCPAEVLGTAPASSAPPPPSVHNKRPRLWAPKASRSGLLPPCNSPSRNLFQEVGQHADTVWCPESFPIMLIFRAECQRAPTRSTMQKVLGASHCVQTSVTGQKGLRH